MTKRNRGFTMIEMLTVIAIVGVIAALGISAWTKAQARSRMTGTVMELQTQLILARQKALAAGKDVVVMFFPKAPAWGGGVGRVIVMLDGDGGFLDGTGALTFSDFNAVKLTAGPIAGSKDDVLAAIDLPEKVEFGPPTLDGGAAPFPFNDPADYKTTGCSFCDAGLTRGAIRFDARGAASFYSASGAPLDSPKGGAVSLNALSTGQIRGTSVLIILPTGLVRSVHAG